MKTVLITGATRNTGLAIAKRFAKEGFQIALTSREAFPAEKTAKAIEKEFSVKCRGYEMTFDGIDSIQRVFQKMEEDFGSLDVFVANSVNLGLNVGLLNATEADFDAICNVNLKGTFFACQKAAELMKSCGGSIVTIGSVQGMGAVFGRTVYAMTKAGISMLVKSMAYELGKFGIRVNNLVAGAIHSVRWDALSEEEICRRREKYPIGRESTEEEIAEAVFFLASDKAGSITGIDFTVDSGLSACLLPYQKQEL